MSAKPEHPGRPREARIDDAILHSAFEVFLERGYLATSLSEIARRAGVGTPAIYRRWPTKADLAAEVVVQHAEPDPIPDSGSIRSDLIEFLRQRIRVFDSPMFQQLLLPALMEGRRNEAVKRMIKLRFVDYRKPLTTRLRRSIDAGSLRTDTDPDRLIDLLMGTVLMPLLFGTELPEEADSDSIVDQVLSGFASTPQTDPGLTRG
jgi:AcrR family transcriptional regulator